MEDPAGTPALIEAIRHLHGAQATHQGSVAVREMHADRVVWDGYVQVFKLTGHAVAQKAYAWSHEEDEGRRRFVVVLELAPIKGPAAAVRAAIVAQSQTPA